ncbi:MAG: DNA primase [Candidatus Zambryskibacteria bacterium RIFCSPHIGHO2_01_FULL_44_22b]|uniref:DNA primase n=2 Tax=Candidatus Zambryskiibacteriota TaxID=1817925 RepID=A0A1G2T0T9_9BACT|nr:MAG: DNA primase [Candidatus Zambryskibacteria bacterium RIFCSPHIGHO2_01_FULL_44_22b]OHB04514.1 MAG: DNA primase [Candidatus Zambryskibacteria bacterium RIFCSPLOWO2_01_FULL_45_43]
MRGNVETIKGRLDLAEVISGYVKLEKAGANFKARCPFHNEKTPSFFVSPVRQNFYCFGCGAKGDIFSFVEQMEGLDFRAALKLLAEKAGVEIEYQKADSKMEKGKILNVLEEATLFFEKQLSENKLAEKYIKSRGIDIETVKKWRIGYATDEWRLLYGHLLGAGYEKNIILKAGLAKISTEKISEPYDVFRDRIIFPLFDANGTVIAFSGRALAKDTEPKYLNSPDTSVFTKGEVLYGLDRAKEDIRKKNYAVLVEGQIDLVLSHQAGVSNTVASSGTAFTLAHLQRLKRLSSRIILAFDGDKAGLIAAEKASNLGISLGFEVKVASLPEGSDPAEVINNPPAPSKSAQAPEGGAEEWKNILRRALPAIEFFLNKLEKLEKDSRKLGKLIVERILPMIKLLSSSIEQSHFISMLSKRTGLKENVLWEDLKRAKIQTSPNPLLAQGEGGRSPGEVSEVKSQRERIEERLAEIKLWKKEIPLEREEAELQGHLDTIILNDEMQNLLAVLARAESLKDNKKIETISKKIKDIHKRIIGLEEKKKIM